jgi:hypothetical protein
MGFKKLSGLRYVGLKYEKSEPDELVVFHTAREVLRYFFGLNFSC